MSVNNIVEQVRSLSVMQLVELRDELGKLFGIDPNAAMAPAAAPAAAAPAAEARTEFDLYLGGLNKDEQKVQKAKLMVAIKNLSGKDLTQTKELFDAGKGLIKSSMSKADIDKCKAELEALGAVIEVK